MRRFLHAAASASLILLFGHALFLPNSLVLGSSPDSPASSVDPSGIGSLGEMASWLDDLRAEALRARQKNRFTFEFQEQVLKKAGESISRILELEKRARLTDPKVAGAFKGAFEKTDEVLRFIIRANEEVIERLQEEELDEAEDTLALLESPAWQMPHRLISLSRYWTSWSGYYQSFLVAEESRERKALLDEAIAGFSLTLLDIAEQTIVAKSLFGRALCFKEMGDDEKAAKDLRAITEHVRHNDPLYMWSLYEQALIDYKAGEHAAALGHLDKLTGEIEAATLTKVLGNEHKVLRERVLLEPTATALLARIEKQRQAAGEADAGLCREALSVLRRLAPYDAAHANRLYRLVRENASAFHAYSYEEAGAIGTLALADDRFEEKAYAEAATRYASLWSSPDPYLRKRLDDVYFRSGYAYCQIGRWNQALASFDQLYARFPRSRLVGKAVCLEYVAAAGSYRQSPGSESYARYLASSKKYLTQCPTPRDNSGAHFFVGKDHDKKKNYRAARKEFSAIEPGTPQYWPARYFLLKYDVEELERMREAGQGGTTGAKRLYQGMVREFETFGSLPQSQRTQPGLEEILPHMALLEARMFRSAPGPACDRALQVLEGFEKRFPKNTSLWLRVMQIRLECCRDLGRTEEAKRQIEALLRDYPVDQDRWDFLAEWGAAYENEAERHADEGKRDQANVSAELALTAYTGMAGIAAERQSYQEHLDLLQFKIAEMQMTRGETEKAARMYREILKRNPEAADALSNLGEIYEAQGRWEEALDVWRRYANGVEAGSDAWLDARYRIAVAHSKQGRRPEACEVITMLRVLHPDAGGEERQKKISDLERRVCRKDDQGPP
jgi:tetratricopeptide (TPR) repeat protein